MHLIRRLEPDDYARLRALRLRALEGEPTAFGSTLAREAAFPDSEWRHRLRVDGNPHFGGFDDMGALVGLAVGAVEPDEPHVGHVRGMWVDPNARGRGLADALVAHVTSWAAERGCRTMRLHLTDGNARAESLYGRLGFARSGRTEVRDRDGLVEVEMEATCPPPSFRSDAV